MMLVIRRAIATLFATALLCVPFAPASAQSPAPTATSAPVAIPKFDEKKYGVYPIAYREIITRWLETELLDASTAKIEWLGGPKLIDLKGHDGQMFYGFVVDFKVNARNKFGMYTGFQTRRVYIRNGEVAGGGRKTR